MARVGPSSVAWQMQMALANSKMSMVEQAREMERALNSLAEMDAPQQVSTPTPTPKGDIQMEVGKIVTQPAQRSTYSSNGEESISVYMSENAITLQAMHDREGRDRLLPAGGMALTAAQALELGQFLLKSAELQPEYAEAHRKLREEGTKLDKRFADMISGLGLDPDVEVSIIDERGTFKVVENILEA